MPNKSNSSPHPFTSRVCYPTYYDLFAPIMIFSKVTKTLEIKTNKKPKVTPRNQEK